MTKLKPGNLTTAKGQEHKCIYLRKKRVKFKTQVEKIACWLSYDCIHSEVCGVPSWMNKERSTEKEAAEPLRGRRGEKWRMGFPRRRKAVSRKSLAEEIKLEGLEKNVRNGFGFAAFWGKGGDFGWVRIMGVAITNTIVSQIFVRCFLK